MIAGGIDLSVGSVVALVGVVATLLVKGVEVTLPAVLGGKVLLLQLSVGWALALLGVGIWGAQVNRRCRGPRRW